MPETMVRKAVTTSSRALRVSETKTMPIFCL